MITIAAYQPQYFNALTAYRLEGEQSEYSRIPYEVLNDPYMMENKQRFQYCILVDEEPAGLFCLDFTEDRFDYTSNSHAVLLRSLSVNPAFQGKGVAKAAMLQLPALVKQDFPGTTEIVFGVNQQNTGAYRLYLKTGYLDSGTEYNGIKGPQYVMYKRV